MQVIKCNELKNATNYTGNSSQTKNDKDHNFNIKRNSVVQHCKIEQLTRVAHSKPEWLSAGIHFRVNVLKVADGRWLWKTAIGRWRWQLTRPHCFRIYRQPGSSRWHILPIRVVVSHPVLRVATACYSEITMIGNQQCGSRYDKQIYYISYLQIVLNLLSSLHLCKCAQ